MPRISVTKEFKWDMAHMLAAHDGLCKNVHGHTYKMEVEVCRIDESLIDSNESSNGMTMDFKQLKDIVNEKIVKPLDHAFIYWDQSPDPVEHEIANVLQRNNRKVFKVDYRPTAENMAMDFYNILNSELIKYSLKVIRIRVWETPTSFAEVKA